MAQAIASSATLVTSTLEAAGYHYQAYLLDVLADPFVTSIGPFLYLIAIVTALTVFLFIGQYKLWKWLIIGPAMFSAVVFGRGESPTPEWRFGGEERDPGNEVLDDAVYEAVEDLNNITPGTANVSKLFAGYNAMISSVMSQAVKVIIQVRKDNKIDHKFLLRMPTHGRLLEGVIDDSNLADIFHASFLSSECSEALRTAREVSDPINPQGVGFDERDRLFENAMNTRVNLNPKGIDYLANMFVDYGGLPNSAPTNQDHLIGTWGAPAEGANPHDWADSLVSYAESNAPPIDSTRDAKLSTARQQFEGKPITCGEIWRIIHGGIILQAREGVKNAEKIGEEKGIEGARFVADLLKIEGFYKPTLGDPTINAQQDLRALSEVTARAIWSNSMIHQTNVYPKFLSRQQTNSGHLDEIKSNKVMGAAENYRYTARAQEWEKKSEAFNYAANLPYYQGVALNFLALMFPFFALLLIIPGKHVAFMHWFVLWLWVKSWDVGFAIVMCLDDVLYDLIASWRGPSTGNPDLAFPQDLVFALESLNEIDPSFNPTMYYSIMAVCLGSIPVVTSQIIMGGLKGGSGLIAKGMSLSANAAGAGSGGITMQNAVTSLRSNYFQFAERNFAANLQAIKQGKPQPFRSTAQREGLENLSDERAGQFLNQSLNSIDNMIDAAAGIEGFAKGAGDKNRNNNNRVNAFESLMRGSSVNAGQMGKARKISAALDSASAIAGPVGAATEQIRGGLLKIRQAQINKAAAWTKWDTINHDMAQWWSQLHGLYGGMPIPWSESPDGYDMELQADLQKFKVGGDVALSGSGLGAGAVAGALVYNANTNGEVAVDPLNIKPSQFTTIPGAGSSNGAFREHEQKPVTGIYSPVRENFEPVPLTDDKN